MPKETTRDYVYLTIVILLAGFFSIAIWKTSESIVYGSAISIATGGIESKVGKSISVTSPKPLSTIGSPVTISGKADNSWFFEASFPVQVIDEDGLLLGQGSVQALSDWTVPGMVAFKGSISFTETTDSRGFVILSKDDPSGMANFPSIKIPIVFDKKTATGPARGSCVVGGCSGEVCADEPAVSSCIYKSEFACYQGATCERQASGACGWTQTTKLTQCINASANSEGTVY